MRNQFQEHLVHRNRTYRKLLQSATSSLLTKITKNWKTYATSDSYILSRGRSKPYLHGCYSISSALGYTARNNSSDSAHSAFFRSVRLTLCWKSQDISLPIFRQRRGWLEEGYLPVLIVVFGEGSKGVLHMARHFDMSIAYACSAEMCRC